MTNDENQQYISADKLEDLKKELQDLKQNKIPDLANRIDEAKQLGDLSENAEYHAAREDMAWAQSRVKELENIIDSSVVITETGSSDGIIEVGSNIKVTLNGVSKEYKIVGQQEADPSSGKISNESPLGNAFLGKKEGDEVEVEVPSGLQLYKIIEVN
ncbi:MAG: transcription elongation factor GreA [Candidatus Magasanikbacteria bacterium]|nr:transcription elongation factor GreA [Candidatus Magasanikbacteria bacterium]